MMRDNDLVDRLLAFIHAHPDDRARVLLDHVQPGVNVGAVAPMLPLQSLADGLLAFLHADPEERARLLGALPAAIGPGSAQLVAQGLDRVAQWCRMTAAAVRQEQARRLRKAAGRG